MRCFVKKNVLLRETPSLRYRGIRIWKTAKNRKKEAEEKGEKKKRKKTKRISSKLKDEDVKKWTGEEKKEEQ